MLAITAVVLAGWAIVAPLWKDQLQRERERELVRVGSLYAQALRAYRDRSPGSERQYPRELEELLLDARFVGRVRHLRSLYPDPLQPAVSWGLMRDPTGRIRGVYSQSGLTAFAQSLPAGSAVIRGPRYMDWHFSADAAP